MSFRLSKVDGLLNPVRVHTHTELNQNRPRAREWVRFENACSKSGYPIPTNWGGKTTFFDDFAS